MGREESYFIYLGFRPSKLVKGEKVQSLAQTNNRKKMLNIYFAIKDLLL